MPITDHTPRTSVLSPAQPARLPGTGGGTAHQGSSRFFYITRCLTGAEEMAGKTKISQMNRNNPFQSYASGGGGRREEEQQRRGVWGHRRQGRGA